MSAENQTLEASATLLNIRRAYRLIATYQKCMEWYVKTIRREMGFREYVKDYENGDFKAFDEGHLALRLTQGESEYPDGRYWDFARRGDALLYIWINTNSGEDLFNEVRETASLMHWWVLENLIDRDKEVNWRDGIVRKIANDRWPKHGQSIEISDIGVRVYCETTDIAQIANEKSLSNRISEFKQTINEKFSIYDGEEH